MNLVWPFNSLTGGGSDALDYHDGALLTDGDLAFGTNNLNAFHAFYLDADSAAAESSPDIIEPDSNAGDKRWIRINIYTDQYEYLWVPASAMVPVATYSPAWGTKEYAANDVNREYYAFDKDAYEAADFSVPFPDIWNLGTVKAKFFWGAPAGAGDVIWGIRAAAKRNDDPIDAAWGTEQEVTDTLIATGDQHITAATSALTIGGTPALGCLIDFEAYRDAANGSDTFSADALLFGVLIQYKVTGIAAAW